MNRIFHQRLTVAFCLCTSLLTSLAFYLFWNRTGTNAIVGAAVVCFIVLIIERQIHTTFTLTADDCLVIYRGRFAKTQTIDVNEITRALAIRTRLHFMSYVLIEYGAGHLTSVQPDDEQEFIRRLHSLQDRRTLQQTDGDEEDAADKNEPHLQ